MSTQVSRTTLNEGKTVAIHQSGGVDEDVTLLHTGDPGGLVLFDTTSGGLGASAGVLPRDVPIRFRLAAKSTIYAMSDGGDRYVTVVATPLAAAAEEGIDLGCLLQEGLTILAQELFAIRCMIGGALGVDMSAATVTPPAPIQPVRNSRSAPVGGTTPRALRATHSPEAMVQSVFRRRRG